MPVAYSYIRFSSKAQELGDSQRRQLKLAQDYASTNGLDLDTTYRDLGISGYRGANRHVGALGVFLRDVDDGVIPPNSWLLVEALDRLTRESLDQALPLLLSIINRGITIVSLLDNHVYSQDTIKRDNGIGLIISITQFVRGNDESKKKSDRLTESWNNKRAKGRNGEMMTTICPYWMRYDKDLKQFVIIEEHAIVIRRIYKLALEGYGGVRIARLFNDEGIKTAKGLIWSPPGIINILKNKAAMGTYAPRQSTIEPIENYYPPVVSAEDWHLVNKSIETRHANNTAGRVTNKQLSIMLSGKMVCAQCGAKLRSINANKEKQYVQCRISAASKQCTAMAINYHLLEEHFIGLIIGVEMQIIAVKAYKDDTDEKIKKLEEARERLMDALELSDDPAPIQTRINARTKEIKELKESRPKHPITAASVAFNRAVGYCSDLLKINAGVIQGDIVPLRNKIQVEMNRLVDKIVVSDKAVFRDGKYWRSMYITGELCVLVARPEGIKIEADVGVHFRGRQRQQVAQPTPGSLEEKLLEWAKEVENLPIYRPASPKWLDRVSKQKK